MVRLQTQPQKVSFPFILFIIFILAQPASSQPETVYFEDFANGPAGWVSVDLTKQKGLYWQLASYDGLGVAWCGTDDPSFVTPPGYGNDWLQLLSKSLFSRCFFIAI